MTLSPAAVLVDTSGNAVGIVLDGSVYRLQQVGKLLNAGGTQINPATQETLVSLEGKSPVVQIWMNYPNDILLRPIAARGIGGFIPEPTAYPEGPDHYGAGPLQVDSDGNLISRSRILTDEESFREDFPGSSLDTNLTGTLSFTNGSDEVTGSGTAFLSELDGTDYIKLVADGVSTWARVMDVISDTELELDIAYTGTTTSGSAHRTHFPTLSTSGIAVSASKVTISSGTTANDHRGLTREADFSPIMLHGYVSVSTRRANQEGHFGFVDDPANIVSCAIVVFDGTNSAFVKFRTSGDGTFEETTVSLPAGYVSSTEVEYEISVLTDEAILSVEGMILARHSRHIPHPYTLLKMHACWFNGGSSPAGSSDMVIDTVFLSNHNRVQIAQGFTGDTIPVQQREDNHNIIAKRSTTATGEVELIAYTVPTGKTLWMTGYCISAGSTTVNATFKIGKGSIPITDPSNPGTVDSGLVRGMFLQAKTMQQEQFASPLYVAAAGETVRVSVNPDGATTTTWRCTLDFVLR